MSVAVCCSLSGVRSQHVLVVGCSCGVDLEGPRTLRRFAVLYATYRPSRFAYELIALLRRAAIACELVFFSLWLARLASTLPDGCSRVFSLQVSLRYCGSIRRRVHRRSRMNPLS